MNFQIDKQEKYTIIKLKVEKLDSNIAPALKSELVILNSQGIKNMVMDLSETRYCDSSGLSAILVANRLCKNSNGIFVLTGMQESVKKLISISQLDTILNIAPTLNEGINMLSAEELKSDNEENE